MLTLHQILRDATRADHVSLDHALSEFDLRDPGGYGRFLNMHHAALRSLEGLWRADDREDFAALLRCVQADLAALGAPLDEQLKTPAAAPAPLSGWGIGYVVRGSRLGSRVLRKRVPARFAASYLDFAPALAWPDFLQRLEAQADALTPHDRDAVIGGAKTAFAVFAEFAAAAPGTAMPGA
jgi:heme oxygenase